MAPVVKKNVNLASLLGSDGAAALATHANDEVDYGSGGSLPAGVEGIAQLSELTFGVYESGDFQGQGFFRAVGIVVSPTEFKDKDGNVHMIEGAQTRLGPQPLCDTPERKRKTKAENVAAMQNELKKLGADGNALKTAAQVEAAINALLQQAPYFRFRTWKGKDSEYVNHQWSGACDYDPDAAPASDSTLNPPANKATAKTATKATAKATAPVDLNAIAAKADAGDQQSQLHIKKLADAAGIDSEAYALWSEVVDALGGQDAGPVSFAGLGALADGGDEQAVATLNQAAVAAGLDPNDYGTWDEVEVLLSGGGDVAVEEVEMTVAEMCDAIDAESEGYEAYIDVVTESATAAGVDVNEYATWAEVAAVLGESGEEGAAEGEAVDNATMAAAIDAGEDDGTYEAALTELATAAGIDPQEYATWAEVADLLDADPAEETEPTGEFLGGLVDSGDDKDGTAEATLNERAAAAGLDPMEYATWVELGQALDASGGEGEATEEFVPSVGESFMYRPKGKRADVECTATAVFASAKTLNLKNVQTGETYRSVPWSAIQG